MHMTHEKVLAHPSDFEVICPSCGESLQTYFSEQEDGGYECDPTETFTNCDCGKLIEITGRWRNLP